MSFTFLERWQPQFLAALRIISGLLFLEHGSIKLLHFPGPPPTMPPGAPSWFVGVLMLAGGIELIGGALVTVGVFTRLAAFIMAGEMAAAYFLVHMRSSFWPAINQGDAAILFCFVFLYLAAAGPGAWAFDKK
jgi:putative oxidoreductase